MLFAQIVIDKFHVMKNVYGAVLEILTDIKKELSKGLSGGKIKTEKDKAILRELELLNRCRRRLTQSVDKWSDASKELINQLFIKYPTLKTAYLLSQKFKNWYDRNSHFNTENQIRNKLWEWYAEVKDSQIEAFTQVVKMIRKHENEIINYFLNGHTNAGAERLNGKIQRFVSANYGFRDKDFSLYRIRGYFS
jgi:transposase